ncbi:MAG: hypothetical protein KDE46_03425 [Caldilineaceae bacterium]|nr:hypothetical protein [Caldilineaceae bacterium]
MQQQSLQRKSLYQHWQIAITEGQESGQTPRLELGQSHSSLDHLWTLHALQSWLATRNDVTTPTIAFGGESALWLSLFLSPRHAVNAPQVREPVLIFSGVERSVQMAAQDAVVPALVAQVAPAGEPGQNLGWEALPFVVQPVTRRSSFVNGSTNAVQWIAWAILLFAAALLLSPLFGAQ